MKANRSSEIGYLARRGCARALIKPAQKSRSGGRRDAARNPARAREFAITCIARVHASYEDSLRTDLDVITIRCRIASLRMTIAALRAGRRAMRETDRVQCDRSAKMAKVADETDVSARRSTPVSSLRIAFGSNRQRKLASKRVEGNFSVPIPETNIASIGSGAASNYGFGLLPAHRFDFSRLPAEVLRASAESGRRILTSRWSGRELRGRSDCQNDCSMKKDATRASFSAAVSGRMK